MKYLYTRKSFVTAMSKVLSENGYKNIIENNILTIFDADYGRIQLSLEGFYEAFGTEKWDEFLNYFGFTYLLDKNNGFKHDTRLNWKVIG
jgi:hypothetical protein